MSPAPSRRGFLPPTKPAPPPAAREPAATNGEVTFAVAHPVLDGDKEQSAMSAFHSAVTVDAAGLHVRHAWDGEQNPDLVCFKIEDPTNTLFDGNALYVLGTVDDHAQLVDAYHAALETYVATTEAA